MMKVPGRSRSQGSKGSATAPAPAVPPAFLAMAAAHMDAIGRSPFDPNSPAGLPTAPASAPAGPDAQ